MPHSAILDQPTHPPNLMFDSPSSFHVEDFFNLDLLSGNDDQPSSTVSPSTPSSADQARGNSNTSSTSSTSRASSEAGTNSPAGSFANLQTPPQSEVIPSFDITGLDMGMNFDSSFGNLPSIDEESIFSSSSQFFKPGTDPLAGLSHSPFDLFGSLESGLSGTMSSDSQRTASTSTSTLPSNMSISAIDPQLVRTPAASTDGRSDVGADPESDEDEQRGLVVAPVKVGGKGKARRGTLHSGGVSKKSSLPGPQSIFGSLSTQENPSVFLGKGSGKGGKSFAKEKSSKDKDQDIDDDKDDDPDDWRPSPEEYAKMSSKEKRQLRNKISARNFRIRRKEYIHTLEGDIADRDRLIEAIRSELGSTKSENNALRQEVAALKRAILEGRASPMLPPPAPLSPLSPVSSLASLPSSTSTNSSTASSNHNIIKPNPHKDLPTSPRLGASPFWGGQTGGFGSLGGGITPVHTAIIPESASVFSDSERHKENINPALNDQPQQHHVLSQVLAQLYGNGETAAASVHASNKEANTTQNGFDNFGFTDLNPFTLKTLDAYRMQLWGRVAAQSHANRSRAAYTSNNTAYPSPPHSSPSYSPKSTNANASVPLSGLASNLRPQYFAPTNTNISSNSSTNKSLGSLLSGKGLHHGLPTPPPSPQVRPANRPQQQQQKQREQAQAHALLATLASQTVLSKLGSAFWDAFCGPSSSRSSTQPHKSSTYGTWDAEKVRRVLDGSAVLRVVDVDRPSSLAPSSTPVSNSTQSSADVLAEGMRSLSLDTSVKQEESERKGFFAKMSSCNKSCSKKHY